MRDRLLHFYWFGRPLCRRQFIDAPLFATDADGGHGEDTVDEALSVTCPRCLALMGMDAP
jgi:hypothetical protein